MNRKDAQSAARFAIYNLVQANVCLLRDQLHGEVERPTDKGRLTTALDDEVSLLYERASRFKDSFDYPKIPNTRSNDEES